MQAKKCKLKPALKFAGELCPPRNRLIVIFDFEARGARRKILKKVEGGKGVKRGKKRGKARGLAFGVQGLVDVA